MDYGEEMQVTNEVYHGTVNARVKVDTGPIAEYCCVEEARKRVGRKAMEKKRLAENRAQRGFFYFPPLIL